MPITVQVPNGSLSGRDKLVASLVLRKVKPLAHALLDPVICAGESILK
jgi:hypothetical protein